MTSTRFTRRALDNNTTQILSLIQFTSGREGYAVQITTPDTGDFVGLYSLDGEQLRLGNCDWELVDETLPEELAGWQESWDVVETIPE